MYEQLTAFIPRLSGPDFGRLAGGEKLDDGTFTFPYIIYSRDVEEFRRTFFEFAGPKKELDIYNYGNTLERYGLDRGHSVMVSADVSRLDGKAVIALICCALRMERFCDGAILGFLEDGCIQKWLERLRDIDQQAQ